MQLNQNKDRHIFDGLYLFISTYNIFSNLN